jgi:predicted Kef-type K+ transport protein
MRLLNQALVLGALVAGLMKQTFMAVVFFGIPQHRALTPSPARACLGNFKGESIGLGLAFSWIPEFGDGRVANSRK